MRMLLIALLALTGCKKELTGEFSECDPLDPTLCALPYPSSFFLAEADTPSGYQVDFREGSLPTNRDDVVFNPALWNEKDGFSIGTALLVYFDDVSLEGVIGHQDLDATFAGDAKTVLIDTTTGERVPHFVELDMTAEHDTERLLMIRPVVPLEFATHYIVGIRNLQHTDGTDIAASNAFAKLRDDEKSDNYDIEGRRAHYEDVIFPALDEEGFAREELLIAWDFVTMSRHSTLGRMEWMREDLYERIGADGPAFTATWEDHDCTNSPIARTVKGKMTVPLYTVEDGPGTLLTRDENGMPFYNGDTQADFTVRIPCSLALDPHAGQVVQYGHGLLGDRSEVETGWLSRFLDDSGWVAVAADWTGMSDEDIGEITLMLVLDISEFGILPERVQQGYIEHLALTRLIMGGLAEHDAVKFPDNSSAMVSVIDPTRVGYYGISQGGNLGGGFLAASPDIERGVFGVGGMPYTILLHRSHDFDTFFALFKNKYGDHREISLMLTHIQMLWDPAESMGWAHDMNRDPAEGMPAHTVLSQVAIGDAQVSTLGAHIQARAYGAQLVSPIVRPVWGLTEASAPFRGSAYVEWKYTDVPDEPIDNMPPELEYDPHECPRREVLAQAQVKTFLETGEVVQLCGSGGCVGTVAETCP